MAGEIFISYRRSDQDKARLLHALLKQRGVDAWYDALVGAGEDWRHKTAQALGAAPIFVLLFSKVASESDDISKELAAATFSKKLVIPVRIDDIKPEGAFLYELASRNWFDAFNDTEARFEILADKLTALVKGGPEADVAAFNLGSAQPPPVIKPAGRPLLKQPLVLGGLAAASVAVIAAVAMFAMGPQTNAALTSQRVAFFGFTTASNDPAAVEIAETATNEAFQTLSIQELDTASRADTTGVQQKTRIDRAAELGARFALSGEVNPETGSGRVSVTMRLEDVTARAALWEETFAEDAATPLPVAVRAATRATEIASCEVMYASHLGRNALDKDLTAAITAFCNWRNTPGVEVGRAMRKLSQLAPNDGDIQGLLAGWLVTTLDSATPTSRPAQLAEAEQAIARALALEPKGYFVAYARGVVGMVQRAPRAEIETLLTTSLQRTPDGVWETYGHGTVNSTYGGQLMSVGRTREALPYFRATVDTGLFSVGSRYQYLSVLAVAGRPEAGDLLQQTFARQPARIAGSMLLSAAVLLGAGDADKLLASPPRTIAADTVRCWRDIHTAIKSDTRKAQADGAARTKACLKDGSLPDFAAVAALARLGDLDGAFGIASEKQSTLSQLAPNPLFSPASRAMRADPRFLPLVEKEGLMEYWKTSGHGPDFCETEDIPVCRELKASAKP